MVPGTGQEARNAACKASLSRKKCVLGSRLKAFRGLVPDKRSVLTAPEPGATPVQDDAGSLVSLHVASAEDFLGTSTSRAACRSSSSRTATSHKGCSCAARLAAYAASASVFPGSAR